jgi:hypothetical protein
MLRARAAASNILLFLPDFAGLYQRSTQFLLSYRAKKSGSALQDLSVQDFWWLFARSGFYTDRIIRAARDLQFGASQLPLSSQHLLLFVPYSSSSLPCYCAGPISCSDAQFHVTAVTSIPKENGHHQSGS